MAKDEKIVALDIGSQQVSSAVFSSTPGGGLRMDRYERSDMVGDPSDDEGRSAQTQTALHEISKTLKLGKMDTSYVISSWPVLTKFSSLPPIDGDKLEEIVEFEAQQQVPYQLKEVVWGYQMVGSPEDFEVEVMLAAVKSEEIEEIDGLVEATGLSSTGVEVAPVALYNALRYNYSDIAGPVMLVDIGARTTDVIFMEGSKVFMRTIKLGGSEMSKSIAAEFGMDLNVADHRKMADGFVALGGPYADHDNPEIAGMSKIIRNSLTRMHSEVMRTINFYRSKQGGSSPELVLLSGGASSLPFIREFFAEKLNVPIDHFNALRNVTVAPKLVESGIAANAHNLGTLVGSALNKVGEVPVDLVLIPESVRTERVMGKRKIPLMLTSAALVTLLSSLGFFFVRGATLSDQKAESISSQADRLTKANGEIGDLKAEIKQIDIKQAPFVDALIERSFWVRSFNYLSKKMETDTMWITTIEPLSGGAQVIKDESLIIESGEVTIDALQVKGLWRENSKGSAIVYDYFASLKEDAVKDVKAGKPPRFALQEIDISKDTEVEVGTSEDRHAYKWKFILPLSPENQVKFTK